MRHPAAPAAAQQPALAPARVCARTPRAPRRRSSRTAASTPQARHRAAAGARRGTCSGGRERRSPLHQRACWRDAQARAGPHQEQYQPRLNRMPHGLHSAAGAASAPAARVQMPLPRRLCALISRRRTRRAAVRQRPAFAPQRGALRGRPGRVRACQAARWPPSLRCSKGSGAGGARAYLILRGHARWVGALLGACCAASRHRHGARCAELGSSVGRRRADACESGAKGAAAQQAVLCAQEARAAGGTGAERRGCAHSRVTTGFIARVCTTSQHGPHGWSVSVSMTVTRRVSAAQSAKTASVLPSFGSAMRPASATGRSAHRTHPQHAAYKHARTCSA